MARRIIKINLKSLSGQFIILIVTVVAAAASMITAIYMLKALKLEDADRCLEKWGNYDFAFCDIENSLKKEVQNDEEVQYTGEVYDYGNFFVDGKTALTGAVKDRLSQQMLYLIPTEGRYPVRKNEICIDELFLRSLGTKKTVGDYVTLKSNDGKKDASEYKIVGIIKAVRSDSGELISNRRYPESTLKMDFDNMKYDSFPLVYIFQDERIKIKKTHLLVDIKKKENISAFAHKYLHNEEYSSKFKFDLDRWNGRLFTVSLIIGDKNITSLGTGVYSDINNRIQGNKTEADPFSKYLIPIYAVLIFIISATGIFYISFDIQQKRYKNYSILLNLGLKRRTITVYLMLETFFLMICSACAGLIFSKILISAVVNASDTWLGTNIKKISFIRGYYEKYIDMVTPDLYKIPMISVFLILFVNLLVNLIMFLVRSSGKPLSGKVKMEYKKRDGRNIKWPSLFSIMTRKINRDRWAVSAGLYITVIIVVVSVVFGYSFFSDYSGKLTREADEELRSSGVNGFDHRIEISMLTINGLSQHMHSSGISKADYKRIESQKYIKRSDCIMSEHSTAVILDKRSKVVSKLKQQSAYRRSVFSSTNAILDNMAEYGYFKYLGINTDKEEVINIPTIGLSEKKAGKFRILEGKIDVDKLRSGDEIIVAVTDRSVKNIFHAGDIIDLYDFITPEDADNSSSGLEGAVLKKYRKKKYEYTETYKGKSKTYYCVDKLVKKKVTIGAVVLCGDKDRDFYFDDNDNGDSYAVNFYTLADAFPSLKLPNVNYTKAGFSLTDEKYHTELDEQIAKLQRSSDYLEVYDSYLIENDKRITVSRNMSFFIVFGFMIIFLGTIVMTNGLYVRIKTGREQYGILYFLGMKRAAVKKYNIIKYIKLIIPSAFISILSLYCFTWIGRYGQKLTMEDLNANRDFTLETRWYDVVKPADLIQKKYILFAVFVNLIIAVFICIVISIIKPDDKEI